MDDDDDDDDDDSSDIIDNVFIDKNDKANVSEISDDNVHYKIKESTNMDPNDAGLYPDE